MGNCQLESDVKDVPATVCCCGHSAEYHLGGPDLTAEGFLAYQSAHPGGDGGMCRAHMGPPFALQSGRCDCFNFCDCHEIVKQIRDEIAEDAAVNS